MSLEGSVSGERACLAGRRRRLRAAPSHCVRPRQEGAGLCGSPAPHGLARCQRPHLREAGFPRKNVGDGTIPRKEPESSRPSFLAAGAARKPELRPASEAGPRAGCATCFAERASPREVGAGSADPSGPCRWRGSVRCRRLPPEPLPAVPGRGRRARSYLSSPPACSGGGSLV